MFSFPGDNLSKYQSIFTKLGMCIDIKEIWFGIANFGRYMIVAENYRFTFLFLFRSRSEKGSTLKTKNFLPNRKTAPFGEIISF